VTSARGFIVVLTKAAIPHGQVFCAYSCNALQGPELQNAVIVRIGPWVVGAVKEAVLQVAPNEADGPGHGDRSIAECVASERHMLQDTVIVLAASMFYLTSDSLPRFHSNHHDIGIPEQTLRVTVTGMNEMYPSTSRMRLITRD